MTGELFSASSLLGPAGGLLGLAFAAGATAGWSFGIRTINKIINLITREREACEKRAAALETEAHDLRVENRNLLERLGHERQMMQIRESGMREIRRQTGGPENG